MASVFALIKYFVHLVTHLLPLFVSSKYAFCSERPTSERTRRGKERELMREGLKYKEINKIHIDKWPAFCFHNKAFRAPNKLAALSFPNKAFRAPSYSSPHLLFLSEVCPLIGRAYFGKKHRRDGAGNYDEMGKIT